MCPQGGKFEGDIPPVSTHGSDSQQREVGRVGVFEHARKFVVPTKVEYMCEDFGRQLIDHESRVLPCLHFLGEDHKFRFDRLELQGMREFKRRY